MKWQAKKQLIATAAATGKRIEVFTAEELTFNPLDSPLVPLHMLMKGKELNDLLARFPKDKLPIIDPRTDIVARFMGLREDDVVKILRPVNPMLVDVETMQIPHPSESLMYRVCRVPRDV
jgi:DNA-directed RNA polymerase subunit H (RpoH/RPB5)